MKAQIFSTDGNVKGSMEIPKFFEKKGREDIVRKVFLANPKRQPYGAFERAGMEHSAHGIFKHRRRAYKGQYGIGISRTPAKVMSHTGTRFTRMGAFAANTRGGREAHPPKSSKIWGGEINKKENSMALMSALSLSSSIEALKEYYPKTDFSELSLPVIVEDRIAEIGKAKEIRKAVSKILGKAADLAGKSILIVAEKKIKAKNLGFESKKAEELNIIDLAPSGKPGRFVIFTESSIKELGKKQWK